MGVYRLEAYEVQAIESVLMLDKRRISRRMMMWTRNVRQTHTRSCVVLLSLSARC